MHNRFVALCLLGCLSLTVFVGISSSAVAGDGEMLYELRTYTCHPGKLPNLHARFKNHTMKIFEKHGMKNVMYWTPVDKEDTLIYVIAHKSREAAEASWKAFREDPEWKKVAKESQVDGKIVMKVTSVFMVATEYSP